MKSRVIPQFSDPVESCKRVWPHYTLYSKQREILYSLRDNFETIVPAGNELGKDFITGMAVLWFFFSRRPCRIVTTSVDNSQLNDVLWGEIRRFLDEAVMPLPIEITGHPKMYQLDRFGKRIEKTECVAKVAQKGEGMLGRHAERTDKNEPTTLLVIDEASGVDDEGYEKADTWAHRILIIGNPFPCTNFFFKGVMEGDRPSSRPESGMEVLHRKVIHIRGEDSPNVQLGLEQKRRGLPITYKDVIPGVLSYAEYVRRRATWPENRQCIGIDGQFYKGGEVFLYPSNAIAAAQNGWRVLKDKTTRKAKGIGIDPAEGNDSTCFAAVDEDGLIELISLKTPNTAVIKARTLAFMRKHGLNPNDADDCSKVCFDRGGGGKQHADYIREAGFDGIRTIGFGSAPTEEEDAQLPGRKTAEERVYTKEFQEVYKNRRAEMAGRLSLRMDPDNDSTPQFTFNPKYEEFRRQLSLIPRRYDGEGKLTLPPKRSRNPQSTEETLIKILGRSPDELDAVMLAVYSMEVPVISFVAG